MNPFKRMIDKTTGLPAVNQQGHPVFTGSAELVSLNTSADRLIANTNGKKFAVATVKFVTASGEIKTCGANIYEGNFTKRMPQPGDVLLATVTIAPDKEGKKTPYMQVSHLIAGGGYADLSDFDLEEATPSPAKQVLTGELQN